MIASPQQEQLPLPPMAKMARTWVLSMLLGFHNAWEQEEHDLSDLGIRIHADHRGFGYVEVAQPERCFFWGESSLLN